MAPWRARGEDVVQAALPQSIRSTESPKLLQVTRNLVQLGRFSLGVRANALDL